MAGGGTALALEVSRIHSHSQNFVTEMIATYPAVEGALLRIDAAGLKEKSQCNSCGEGGPCYERDPRSECKDWKSRLVQKIDFYLIFDACLTSVPVGIESVHVAIG